MTERKSGRMREEVLLAAVAVLLGALGAAGYGAWHALSREGVDVSERWSAFGDALVFPGPLILAGVAAMVWLGWKANIDD